MKTVQVHLIVWMTLDLDIESISIELSIKYVKPIIFLTLYRLPDSLVEFFDPIEKLVSNIDQENKECIIINVLSR